MFIIQVVQIVFPGSSSRKLSSAFRPVSPPCQNKCTYLRVNILLMTRNGPTDNNFLIASEEESIKRETTLLGCCSKKATYSPLSDFIHFLMCEAPMREILLSSWAMECPPLSIPHVSMNNVSLIDTPRFSMGDVVCIHSVVSCLKRRIYILENKNKFFHIFMHEKKSVLHSCIFEKIDS